MSDIFVRLLNFNESVFTRKSTTTDSMQSSNVEQESMKSLGDSASLAAARVIRQGTIFSIIERLGSDYSFDQQKTALSCLLELPEDPQILSVLV